ncbi:MAG: hypothetical protein JWM19_346 [Actinomycetia bacterium]|jgi:hypothetical protein|nr:hypothetical protein [Actinomycetes bacterium]
MGLRLTMATNVVRQQGNPRSTEFDTSHVVRPYKLQGAVATALRDSLPGYFAENKCGLLFLEAHRHLKRLAEITSTAAGLRQREAESG